MTYWAEGYCGHFCMFYYKIAIGKMAWGQSYNIHVFSMYFCKVL